MSRPSKEAVPLLFVILLLVGPLMAAVPMFFAAPAHGDAPLSVAPMTESRAVSLSRMTGAAPTIDGSFNLAAEWTEATSIDAGQPTYTDKIYLMADGEWLYVLVDVVSDTDLTTFDGAPPPTPKEYTAMIWDGNNDVKITYANGAAGSSGVSQGGKNADFGFFIWGDNTVWNSPVTTQGNSIIITPGAGGNSVVATGFGTTPNSATPHRVHEYKIAYDGPSDDLGCTLGYSFTKGFNLQTFSNVTDTSTLIGQWPTNLANLGTSYDTATLPQKYPHILSIKSPKDAATYQTGQEIRFEIDATDNSMPTLTRTLLLNGQPIDMAGQNLLIKNNIAPGQYTVGFKIQDDEGLSDTKDLGKITIAEKEEPPTITSSSPEQTSVSIDENKNITFSVNWHDDNLDQANESVTVAWTKNGAAVNVAAVTKYVFNATHFTSNYTFDAKFTDSGTYNIMFKLTDTYFGQGLTDERAWTLTVNNVNRGPSIFNTEPEFSGKVTMTETEPKQFTIEKVDPDLDPLTVKWYLNGVEQTGAANKNTYTFNSNFPDYNLAGNYVIKVTISDGTFSDTVQWNVTVTNVNRGPEFITVTPEEGQIELKEGQSTTMSFTANDQDQDNLTYKWTINDMVQNTATSNEFEFVTSFLPADGRDSTKSPYYVAVNVSDGSLSIEKEWKIVVSNVNRPPVPAIDRPAEGSTYLVDQDINFKTTTSKDPDGDPLTYSWDFADKKTDAKAEVNHKYAQSGKYKVILSVSDGHVSVSKTVNITIVIPILRLDQVVYAPSPAKEGDVLNITVEITNLGSADARNVRILFYLGSMTPANALPAVVVDNISANKLTVAKTTWVATKPGNTLLIAAIEEGTNYQIDGRRDKQVMISVEAKPKPPVNNPLANPLLWGGIGAMVALFAIVGIVAYKRKKEADAKEDAAVKAIMDAKTKKEEYRPKSVESSPYDRTDFNFTHVAGEPRPCLDCHKETTNASSICNDCGAKRKAREAKAKMMACPVCGNEVSKDMFTCPYCHFNFSKADKAEEDVEKKHEAIGYVSDDACADCGVIFNDNMTVLKCPACQATYHTRCASRLENCTECNADLTSGQTKLFMAPEPKMADLAETVPLVKEEIAAEADAEKKKAVPAKPEGPVCPSCGDEVEEGWKVCPSCDATLGVKAEATPALKPEKKEVPPIVDRIMAKLEPSGLTVCPKCGEDVEPDWKVCPSCDASLAIAVQPKRVEKAVVPPKPTIETKKVEDKSAVAGKCPKCGDDVEPEWKVCPSCDTPLAAIPKQAPTVMPKKEEPKEAPKEELDDIDQILAEEPTSKPKGDETHKKKIVWSKTAKDKAHPKETSADAKTEEKAAPKKVEPEPKKPAGDELKTELDVLSKEIEKLEKEGKEIKKAKSLATLASSFLKGKQPDKAKIYIERSRTELKKL